MVVVTNINHTNTKETAEQYVDRMIVQWGFEHVEYLFNEGYEPVLTDEGKWAFRKVQ